jgi:mono/diheme cytochrome c family protein
MRRLLRWVVRVVVVLAVVLAITFGFVYWRSETLLAQHIDVKEAPLTIASDADSVARGEHLAMTRGCVECHGRDWGGKMVVDVLPVGRIAAPNVTRGTGGLPENFGAADWERAVRHGLAPDGRMLAIMPTRDFNALTDADMADMIAYLQQIPRIDRQQPAIRIGPIPRLQMLLGTVPLAEARVVDQHAAHVAAMTPAPTAEYGRYLAHTCTGCHGEHFSGGRIPGLPPSFPVVQNITPDPASGIGHWTKMDFYTAMRTGKRPDGTALDPFMPWATFKVMSDTELDALWAFLQTLPPSAAGLR